MRHGSIRGLGFIQSEFEELEDEGDSGVNVCEPLYNENGDEYIGIKAQNLERFWNKLHEMDTDTGNSFHEAHFEYTLNNALPDDDEDSMTTRKVVAINKQRIRCEVDIMNATARVKQHGLRFTKLCVTVGVGKHVYSDDTTHIVRHMDQMKSEQLEWFKLLQYGDAGNFYYKTNWPALLTVTGSNTASSKGLDVKEELNGTYRWVGTEKMDGDNSSSAEYPKYRHLKSNGFIDMKYQHHSHSRIWNIRNKQQVSVFSAKGDDCHRNKAPPESGWFVTKGTTEPTPLNQEEGQSWGGSIKIVYDRGWAEKGPTSITQLEKLYHIGRINLDTRVREAKPNTPLTPMRTAKHPGMVELRQRLEETGPIVKQDDNLLHNAVDHIPKLYNIFNRHDLNATGYVANEDLSKLFVEMKMDNRELIEGLQHFKISGKMIDMASFLSWAVKHDLKSDEANRDSMATPKQGEGKPNISRAVSIDNGVNTLSPTEGTEGLPIDELVTPRDKNLLITPRQPGSRRTTGRTILKRDKNNTILQGNRSSFTGKSSRTKSDGSLNTSRIVSA